MKRQMCYIALLLGMKCIPLYAQSAGDMLVKKLNSIQSISADFNQTVKANNKKVSQAQGHMAIQRPGHFRWETKKPIAELLMADGHQVWIYEPELEQVTIKKQGQAMRGTPALFLSSSNDTLLQDFDVNLEPKGKAEIYHLQAKSTHPTFVRMRLSFNGPQLQSIFLEDQLGQKTDLSLKQVKQNLSMPKTLFQFKPPRGVDVIRE